ncbi:dTDP-4-dehydrorhamnose reductase family protein [Niabella sp. CJ426]|uniref:dTDP-4-dehydrorhamnose reductase family protein n=1 Tax=Niabella sp. CJ426 TaxID=3393740 RepID=UPI003D02AEA0
MMKRVLILGAAGMAGHVVYNTLKNSGKYVVTGTYNNTRFTDDLLFLDITVKDNLINLINQVQPDIVVNCIGVLIKGSVNAPANAIYVNAYFPHFLEELLSKRTIKLIHISTDCVFSGKLGNYVENSPKDAKDLYGQSKALGEVTSGNHLTIRTSIVGPELKNNGEGLFDWFMAQSGGVNGFINAFWGGVTTIELAKGIDRMIEQNLTGIYNYTNSEKISKYDLLNNFKIIFGKDDVVLRKFENDFLDKSLIDTRKELKHPVPSYVEMVEEMYQYILENKSLYPNYVNR